MAPYGFAIAKEFQFRGVVERFSNVYHYDIGAFDPAAWSSYIDQIVAAEKLIFANTVNFKEARVFGPTNQGAVANVMQEIKDLTGTGSLVSNDPYPELACVVNWPMPRSPTTGRKRFLRKYLHCHSGISAGSDPLVQAAQVTRLNTYALDVVQFTGLGGGTADLCSPAGVFPVKTPYVLPKARIRQLKR
jgi:hypothetical protein